MNRIFRVSLQLKNSYYNELMSIKEQARVLVESLPEDSTWEDLMYEIYVRESVERGLEDLRAGRVKTSDEVRAKFGLSK